MSAAPSRTVATSVTTPSISTDCFACRLTGTLTFAAVGVYALTLARTSAKTTLGRASAVTVGLGQSFGASREAKR